MERGIVFVNSEALVVVFVSMDSNIIYIYIYKNSVAEATYANMEDETTCENYVEVVWSVNMEERSMYAHDVAEASYAHMI